MSLPTTLLLALAPLLVGVEAQAQASPAREQRQRSVTVTGNPADPPYEIRANMGVSTVLVFKSRINGTAVEVDRTRVKIIEAGEWSILFEPVIDLGNDERLVLSVPFADGQRAVFVLVSNPSNVDTRIDVVRREQTIESCHAELAETQAKCSRLSPGRIARAGWLTPKGVIARPIDKCTGATRTATWLICTIATAYRAETWALVDVMISNESNGHPWIPSEVTIKGMKSGVLVKGTVELEPAQILPGEVGRVFVEMEPPTNAGESFAGESFVLELRDAAGRGITIPEVNLSAQEDKR